MEKITFVELDEVGVEIYRKDLANKNSIYITKEAYYIVLYNKEYNLNQKGRMLKRIAGSHLYVELSQEEAEAFIVEASKRIAEDVA